MYNVNTMEGCLTLHTYACLDTHTHTHTQTVVLTRLLHTYNVHVPPPRFSRLGIQVSLTIIIHVCLSGLWLGGLLYVHVSFVHFSKTYCAMYAQLSDFRYNIVSLIRCFASEHLVCLISSSYLMHFL